MVLEMTLTVPRDSFLLECFRIASFLELCFWGCVHVALKSCLLPENNLNSILRKTCWKMLFCTDPWQCFVFLFDETSFISCIISRQPSLQAPGHLRSFPMSKASSCCRNQSSLERIFAEISAPFDHQTYTD